MLKKYFCVLAIAGSDSSGGAGIQADIKTIAATGGYAASVITVLTAQNTQGVSSIFEVDADFVAQQLDSVFQDIEFTAVKIGMLYRPDVIRVVASKLKYWRSLSRVKNVVLDPVMVAKSGHKLITNDALQCLKQELLMLADLITPNLDEAEELLQCKINLRQGMEKAAIDLATTYQTSVLVKGGHLFGKSSDDVLYSYPSGEISWFNSPRIVTKNTHGTGCTFSSAIASYLAQGNSLKQSVLKAKDYLNLALSAGSSYTLGHGCGPVCHFNKQHISHLLDQF